MTFKLLDEKEGANEMEGTFFFFLRVTKAFRILWCHLTVTHDDHEPSRQALGRVPITVAVWGKMS